MFRTVTLMALISLLPGSSPKPIEPSAATYKCEYGQNKANCDVLIEEGLTGRDVYVVYAIVAVSALVEAYDKEIPVSDVFILSNKGNVFIFADIVMDCILYYPIYNESLECIIQNFKKLSET